jgi:hypothetical protein
MCVDAESPLGTYFGFGLTGKNGRYRVGGLNPGTYQLVISNCGGAAAGATVVTIRADTVSAGFDPALTK